jgi:putative colanic acid biosynthesis glycosyltransferase WcaI
MKPRLLVLNQYYRPGLEATAHLLAELCDALSADFDVTVVTGRLRGFPDLPSRERHGGVEVIRVESTAYDRASLASRGANYLTYLARALRVGLRSGRPDVVLCMTDPPMVGDIALAIARRHRVPLVVITQDVFPEIAVELRRLTNPALVAMLRVLVGAYIRRADRLVAIGEAMQRRLEEKGARPDRIRVIPNWVDTSLLQPAEKRNDWARERDLADAFVVMHSGNVGHAQDLDSLVRAAAFLRDLDDLRIVIIGGGARHAELVALSQRLEVDQVRFLDYQPRDRLSETLSAADVHVVGLARGLEGFVVPSRLYGVLAVGRPVIAAADGASELARIVSEVGCGIVVPPGRPEILAAAIRDAYDRRNDLDEMGDRGRAYVVAEADRTVAIRRYRELLQEVLGTARG